MSNPIENWPRPTGNYSDETYQMFREGYECTEEDVKVQFTTEQLKELCLKHNCKVIASRWNIVYEYGLWLHKEGRFEGKSERYKHRLVTKGVNRHKHLLMYPANEIQLALSNEWRLRKKDSILSLKRWESQKEQREKQAEELGTSCDGIALLSNAESNQTQSPAIEEELPNSSEDSIGFSFSLHSGELSRPLVNEEQAGVGSMEPPLPEPEVDEILCNDFNINTESMTVSNIGTQSMQIVTQDIFSEEFINNVTWTSTQQ